MAVISHPSSDSAALLTDLVGRWERRLRLTQMVRGLPIALAGGLAIACVLAGIARLRPLLAQPALIAACAGLVGSVLIGLLAAVWLPRRPVIASAQRFDRLFGLDERVSTALELLNGRIRAADALTAAQIEDARYSARAARVTEHLPVRHDARAWLAAFVLLAALITLIALPNPQAAAIAEAAAALQTITAEVADETALTDAQRDDLLRTLDANRTILQQPGITPQEAFAAVTEVQSSLQAVSASLQNQFEQAARAAQTANNALDPGAAAGENAAQDLQATLEALRQQAEQAAADQAAREALADQLRAAADELAATNPEAAQALREAAEALENGDPFAAQEAMERAQQSIAEQQQEQQAGQSTQQTLDQSAGQAQAAAQSISQSAAQGDTAQADPQPGSADSSDAAQNPADPNQPQADAQGQSAQQSAQQQDTAQQGGTQGQQGAEGQQSQQGAASSPGDQTAGQQSGEGEGQSAQSADGGQAQDGAAAQGNVNTGLSGSALSQAGDQAGGAGQDEAQAQGSAASAAAPSNAPDGTGQGEYEQVYAPRRIGDAPGGETVFLESDTQNAPVVTGEFGANAAGQSIVPYNQVFGQYQQAANAALDTGRIPLTLRDVVRGYFSALQPR